MDFKSKYHNWLNMVVGFVMDLPKSLGKFNWDISPTEKIRHPKHHKTLQLSGQAEC